MQYYSNKLKALKDILGTNAITLTDTELIVDKKKYLIVEDVIILLDPRQYPQTLKKRLALQHAQEAFIAECKEGIQYSFGDEWTRFPYILPEHKNEFKLYFDIVNINEYADKRVCDLGCGIGRWSYFFQPFCREIILLDFSEAIFVARNNLKECSNAFFFMGDIEHLPFKYDFCDFIFCLGVLHHLETPALTAIRRLKPYAPSSLYYLYYALDNRPAHYRYLLATVTILRKVLCTIRNPKVRDIITTVIAICIYLPLVYIGKLFNLFGKGALVPLYEGHKNDSLHRIRQDVYDRFFTGIEQRFTKKEIMTLTDTYSQVTIANTEGYWHFYCLR